MALTLNGTTGIVTPGVTDTGNLSVAGTTALTTPLPVTSGGTGATSLSGITVGTATNATNATTATNLAAGSAGTVPYQSASGTTAMLAAGTSGQVLTSSGAGAPTWTTPSAGAMVYISSATASNSASVAFTGLTTTYAYYVIEFDSLFGATAGYQLQAFVSTDNGVSYLGSSAYKWGAYYIRSSSSSGVVGDPTGNNFIVAGYNDGFGNSTSAPASGTVKIFAPNSVASMLMWESVARGSTGVVESWIGGGDLVTPVAFNAIKFQANVNITGNFRLYGIAKA